MITIIFEPHSTTTDNEAQRASGWNDVDLSGLGIKQSHELITRCKARTLDAIFCSDLQRAVKTAVPTADELQLPIYVDKRLRECDYGELTQADKHEVESQRADRIDTPFPGGESYQHCAERIGQFLEWLKANFDGKTAMIIGHRATQYGLEHHLLGKDLKTCVTEPWQWQPGWTYQLGE